jgi:dienelactone hydrolase
VGVARPALKTSSLPHARYFELTSRDGLKLTGRFLAPVDAVRPPLIVRVGPEIPGPLSRNEFDPTAHFFASRGFASVRLHVRGTAGFGRTFREAGDLELTGGMVRDLEDGIAWLAGQGWIDEKRVAILGEGLGGITAVHAAQRGRYRAWLNFGTEMIVRKAEIEQLSSSDRSREELTAKFGGRPAVLNYVKSLDPLAAAGKVTVPSFHYYPRGESSHEMTESGRLLKAALAKHSVPVQFHVDPANRDADPAALLGNAHEAAATFLKKIL